MMIDPSPQFAMSTFTLDIQPNGTATVVGAEIPVTPMIPPLQRVRYPWAMASHFLYDRPPLPCPSIEFPTWNPCFTLCRMWKVASQSLWRSGINLVWSREVVVLNGSYLDIRRSACG